MRRALQTTASRLSFTTLIFHVLARELSVGDGSLVMEERLKLEPRACSSFGFGVPSGHSYIVSLEPADSAAACSATKGIRWTAEPYKQGRCIKRKTKKMQDDDIGFYTLDQGCKIPGSGGVQSGEEMCSNWEKLNTTWLAENNGNCTRTIEASDFRAHSDRMFFIAMMSMSDEPQTVHILVSKKAQSGNSYRTSRTYSSGYKGYQSSEKSKSKTGVWIALAISLATLLIVITLFAVKFIYRSHGRRYSAPEVPQNLPIVTLPQQGTK